MGKPQFEDSWKDIFDRASPSVPEGVWTKIEIDLISAENKKNKTRVVFYQRLAATVAVCALLLATYITYDQVDFANNTELASDNHRNPSNRDNESNDAREKYELNDGGQSDNATSGTSTAIANGIKEEEGAEFNPARFDQSNGIEKEPNTIAPASRNRKASKPFALAYPEVDVSIKQKKFYKTNFPRRLPAMPSFLMASRKKEPNKKENLWASLGFAGGSYDPGDVTTNSGSVLLTTTENFAGQGPQQPQSAQASVGNAYSFGAGVGTRVANHWVIQTGLNYVNQNIDYTSNYTSLTPENLQIAAVADYGTVIPLSFNSPYAVRSINEYISIPFQMGYLIVDRKLGLQINAGVSTDFFLKNTLKDESGQIENRSQSAGEESPYRSVNWNGLVGVELSHRVADHYRVSVVPGVRYAFNSILKDDAVLAYNPLVLDIGLRFKYIFN